MAGKKENIIAINDKELQDFFQLVGDKRYDRVAKALTNNPQLVNAQNEDGDTALNVAIKAGDSNLSIELLKGADVNIANKDEVTALHLAVKTGDDELVRLLLENGAKIDAIDNHGEQLQVHMIIKIKLLFIMLQKEIII